MIKYHVFYAELMCLCELISRLNSKVSFIFSYVENFLNIICDFNQKKPAWDTYSSVKFLENLSYTSTFYL